MKNSNYTRTFLSLFFIVLNLYSTNYPIAGEDKPVGIYPSGLLVRGGDHLGVLGTDERPPVQGLVWLSGGLTSIAGPGNYCPIATPFPIDREIGLNEDYKEFLVLVSDLFLANNITLTVSGNIQTKYGRIVLTGEADLSSNTLIFPGTDWEGKINGNGNVLDFSSGGGLKHEGNNICLENIYLKGISKNSIILLDRSKELKLTNCIIQLNGDFTADFDLDISGEVLVTGSGHSFCVNRYLNLEKGGRLIMDVGTTFSMGYPGTINASGGSVIHFNGCNIEIGDNYGQAGSIDNGFYMRNGLVVFENKIIIDDSNNSKDFIIGSDAEADLLCGARVICDGTTTFSIL